MDCSTIDTETSFAVLDAVREKSKTVAFYDAPVSGGSLGASAGTLTFMVGCALDDHHFPLLKELLSAMGSSIFPCGGVLAGADGQVMQ